MADAIYEIRRADKNQTSPPFKNALGSKLCPKPEIRPVAVAKKEKSALIIIGANKKPFAALLLFISFMCPNSDLCGCRILRD